MTKHESVTVPGIVIYCDKCRKAGPGVAYENHDDLTECAEIDGWSVGDSDLCSDCKPKKKRRKGAT